VHLPVAPADNVERGHPAVHFFQHPSLGLRGLGKEAEPQGFGKPVGHFGEAKEIHSDQRLGIGQEQVEKHFSWPRHPAGFLRFGVVKAQLCQQPMATLDLSPPAICQRRSPHAALGAKIFDLGLAEIQH